MNASNRVMGSALVLLFCLLSSCKTGGRAEADPGPLKRASRGAAGRVMAWRYPETPMGPNHVLISIPKDAASDNRYPVLIALHGRGESLKSPAEGARGFLYDYGMQRALQRLSNPPLEPKDLLGMIDAAGLSAMNQSLKRTPYRGLIVVCPYLPDRFRGEQTLADARLLAGFLVDDLLPRVYRETPAIRSSKSTGIDGVSLGGRAALLVGLLRPRDFGAVSGLQAALSPEEVEMFAGLAESARKQNPALKLRLLSSDRDYFLRVNRRLSSALARRAVKHRFDEVQGDHSYEFNRGPGVYSMLLYHDRVLRAETPSAR